MGCAIRPHKPPEEGGWGPATVFFLAIEIILPPIMRPFQPPSLGSSHRSGYPGSETLTKQLHKKGANSPPRRRSARLQQLHSVQSHRKPAFVSKSTLPFRTFHLNDIARIYRRSKHKHFPHLVQELESQGQQLTRAGKNFEDSDSNQSIYSTPTASPDVSSVDFDSEASEDSLSAPSDTEIFDLRVKSPEPSPVRFISSTSSISSTSASASVASQADTSIRASSPSLSTSYVPPSISPSVTPSTYGRRRIQRPRRRQKRASLSSSGS